MIPCGSSTDLSKLCRATAPGWPGRDVVRLSRARGTRAPCMRGGCVSVSAPISSQLRELRSMFTDREVGQKPRASPYCLDVGRAARLLQAEGAGRVREGVFRCVQVRTCACAAVSLLQQPPSSAASAEPPARRAESAQSRGRWAGLRRLGPCRRRSAGDPRSRAPSSPRATRHGLEDEGTSAIAPSVAVRRPQSTHDGGRRPGPRPLAGGGSVEG